MKKKCDYYTVFWAFFIGGIAGALIEIVFCRFTMGRWMSRSSFLYGQFSLVWGLGVGAFTLVFHNMANKRDLYIFFSGTFLGGCYEYLCSFIIEKLFKVQFWNYSKHPFNINGRINLLYCFFWGLVALLWVKDIYPRLRRLIQCIPLSFGKAFVWAAIILLLLNALLSSAALCRVHERSLEQSADTELDKFIDQNYPTEYMLNRYQNLLVPPR